MPNQAFLVHCIGYLTFIIASVSLLNQLVVLGWHQYQYKLSKLIACKYWLALCRAVVEVLLGFFFVVSSFLLVSLVGTSVYKYEVQNHQTILNYLDSSHTRVL